jgi:hypothetical protein
MTTSGTILTLENIGTPNVASVISLSILDCHFFLYRLFNTSGRYSGFNRHMTGICGDCDGLKNDLKKKDGTDVTDDNNKFSMIGDSYTLKDEAEDADT